MTPAAAPTRHKAGMAAEATAVAAAIACGLAQPWPPGPQQHMHA